MNNDVEVELQTRDKTALQHFVDEMNEHVCPFGTWNDINNLTNEHLAAIHDLIINIKHGLKLTDKQYRKFLQHVRNSFHE